MEHVTDINKDEHLSRCMEVVKETIMPEHYSLTEKELMILTKEIMETSLSMGGDYSDENIRYYALQYIFSGFLPRFKMAHEYDEE